MEERLVCNFRLSEQGWQGVHKTADTLAFAGCRGWLLQAPIFSFAAGGSHLQEVQHWEGRDAVVLAPPGTGNNGIHLLAHSAGEV